MAELIDASNRQLIPRWHTSDKIRLMQTIPQIRKENASLYKIPEKKIIWENTPTVNNAIDLFTSLHIANLTSTSEYTEIKEYLLSKNDETDQVIKRIISPREYPLYFQNGYIINKLDIYKILRNFKKLLKEYPNDPLIWNDISFYYAVIGENVKAEHSMRIAFNINANNPFISRSYARLLVHFEEPEKALYILKRTGGVKSHPEILSADIAIRSTFDIGKPNITAARKIIDLNSSQPTIISELSAALGTIEIKNGAIKKGKRHLVTSSICPTENTVAQLKWMNQQHNIIIPLETSATMSLEADAIMYYNKKDYLGCRNTLMRLHEFQPFSESALIDAGYISTVALDEPQFVCNFSENSYGPSLESFSAQNNHIVAKLLTNNLVNIEKMLRNLKLLATEKRDKAVFSATFGMYQYYTGQIKEAKMSYDYANILFRTSKDNSSLALSMMYQGITENRLGIDSSRDILNKAKVEAKKSTKRPELLERINKEISLDIQKNDR